MAVLSRCYQILGLSRKARLEEVKKAFRELALRWHPDHNPQDPAAQVRFRKILEAYEAVLDHFKEKDGRRNRPKRRDRPAEEPWSTGETAPRDGQDIFNEYFGFDRHHQQSVRPSHYDLRFDLQVSRQVLADGGIESIDYQRLVFCRDCFGPGGMRTTVSLTCPLCHGQGEMEEWRSIPVRIPPGSQHGTRLRIPFGGDQLQPGDPAGDLIILLLLGK